MSDATPYVGRAMKRVEDPRLIQGLGTYTDDLKLAGLMHACILRSPHAHARIRRIETSAAKAIPGVVAVFTGADVNDACGAVPCAAAIPDLKAPRHTALAGDRVYFVGHAVAVAVATSPYIARDAIDAIDVDYDPLPAVVDAENALKSGSALTHPDMVTNVAYTHVVNGGSDIDAAFRSADRIIRSWRTGIRSWPSATRRAPPAGCSASASRPTSRSARWDRRRRCPPAAGSGAACGWKSQPR